MASSDVVSRPGRGGAQPERLQFGVVNYNGGESVLRCVRSILAQEGPECGVWVLDNASTDGSAERVEREAPAAAVIRSDRNLGYAGALNRLVARMDADVVVLCNMDVEFDAGWASAVVGALAAEPTADAVATVVLEGGEPPVVNSVGVRFWNDLHAQNVGSGEPYREGRAAASRERAFGSYGAVMCLRRKVAEAVGFDDDYFLFFEETDFFLRFHLLGHRDVFAAGAVARHQRSLSTRRYSPLKLYYGERNRLTTVFKLLPVWYWPLAGAHTLGRLLRLARGQGRDRAGPTRESLPPMGTILWTLLRAWSGAVRRLPGTLRKRRAFWRRAPGTPRDALALVHRYALRAEELRLR